MALLLALGIGLFLCLNSFFSKHPILIDKPKQGKYNWEDWREEAAAFRETITCTEEQYALYEEYVLSNIPKCTQELREECLRLYGESQADYMMEFVDPNSRYADIPHGLHDWGNIFSVREDNRKLRDVKLRCCHLVQMYVAYKYGKISEKISYNGYIMNNSSGDHYRYGKYLVWLEKEMHRHGVREDLIVNYEASVEYTTITGMPHYERAGFCQVLHDSVGVENATAYRHHINFAPLIAGCPANFVHCQHYKHQSEMEDGAMPQKFFK